MPTWKTLFKGPRALRLGMNIWPPFVGAGIEVEELAADYRYVRVVLKAKVYNRNYVGTHFGGSLFAMTDPFYMLMLLNNMGSRYYVWDKSSKIEYLTPAKGRVCSEMRISEADLDEIYQATAGGEKYERDFIAEVLDEQNQVVARVNKRIYARLKPEHRPSSNTLV